MRESGAEDPAKPAQISDPVDCKITNACCFKLLTGQLVKQQYITNKVPFLNGQVVNISKKILYYYCFKIKSEWRKKQLNTNPDFIIRCIFFTNQRRDNSDYY